MGWIVNGATSRMSADDMSGGNDDSLRRDVMEWGGHEVDTIDHACFISLCSVD